MFIFLINEPVVEELAAVLATQRLPLVEAVVGHELLLAGERLPTHPALRVVGVREHLDVQGFVVLLFLLLGGRLLVVHRRLLLARPGVFLIFMNKKFTI